MQRTAFASLATALALSCFISTASSASGPEISHFKLQNGMEVVVIPDRRTPVVTHMVWYRVGAADEAPGKSGIAHFLEHLMFKGTEKNPAGRFSQTLATIGGQENAFTSSDYTGYFQRVTRDRLQMVMEFEADRMTGLKLTDEAVLPERNVVLEEQNSRVANSPAAKLGEEVAGRALSQSSVWPSGDRLASRDRKARPQGCDRFLQSLVHAQQRDAGGRRRRHRRRSQEARRGNLRQDRAARRNRPAQASAGAGAALGAHRHLCRSARDAAEPAAQLSRAVGDDRQGRRIRSARNPVADPGLRHQQPALFEAGDREAARDLDRCLVSGHGARLRRALASTARRATT